MPERRFKSQITEILTEQLPDTSGGALEKWLAPTTESKIEQIPVEQIRDRGWRSDVDRAEPAYRALKASIRASGVLQPLLLRPHADGGFEVVSGARRLSAARETAQSTVPAVVRELNDVQALVGGSWDAVLRVGLSAAEGRDLVARLVGAGMEEGQAVALVDTVPVRELAEGEVEASPAAEVVVHVDESSVVEGAAVAVEEEAPAAIEEPAAVVEALAVAEEVSVAEEPTAVADVPVVEDVLVVEEALPAAEDLSVAEEPTAVADVLAVEESPAAGGTDGLVAEVPAVEEAVATEPVDAAAEARAPEEIPAVDAEAVADAPTEPDGAEITAAEAGAPSSVKEAPPDPADLDFDDLAGWPAQGTGSSATAPRTPPTPLPVDPVAFPVAPLTTENGAAPATEASTPEAAASPEAPTAPEAAPSAEAPTAEAARTVEAPTAPEAMPSAEAPTPEAAPSAEAPTAPEAAPSAEAPTTLEAAPSAEAAPPTVPAAPDSAAVAAPATPQLILSAAPYVIPIKLPEPESALTGRDEPEPAGSMPVAAPRAGSQTSMSGGSRLANEPVPAVRIEPSSPSSPTSLDISAMLRRGPLFYAVLGIGLAVGAIVFILVTVVEGVGSGTAPIIAAVVVAVVGFVTAMISLAQPRQRR